MAAYLESLVTLFETSEDSPLPGLLADCDAVERRWFLENFYPNYDLIIEILLDLEEQSPETHDEFGNPTGSDIKWLWSIDQVARKHNLSAEWVDRNVCAVISYRDNLKVNRHNVDSAGGSWTPIKEAGGRFAVYTAEQNPLMPMCRIVDAVHEFVPDLSEWAIRRRLNREGLNGTVRRERSRWTQRHMYCPNVTDAEYEQYLDRVSFDPHFAPPQAAHGRLVPQHIIDAVREGGEDERLSLRKAATKHGISAKTVDRIRNRTGAYAR